MDIAEIDAPGDGSTDSQSRGIHLSIPRWVAGAVPGVGVGVAIAVLLIQTGLIPFVTAPVEAQVHMTHEELPGLFEEIRCPCCGDSIAECTCPMAAERRQLITERVTLGDTREEIYEWLYLHDGPDAFFDPVTAEQTAARLTARLPDLRPSLIVEEAEIDLGTISMADGLASAEIEVRNEGTADLVITGLSTSCMCTTAALETDDGMGPTFGSSEGEETVDWPATLAPGESATLTMTFDPNAHGPEAVGQFTRVVTIMSNDPLRSQVDVSLVVNVVQ